MGSLVGGALGGCGRRLGSLVGAGRALEWVWQKVGITGGQGLGQKVGITGGRGTGVGVAEG